MDMGRYLPLVISFCLLGISSVYPRLAQDVARTVKIRWDSSRENFEPVQEDARSSRVIRGLPNPDEPYPGYLTVKTPEQLAAAKKQQERSQREAEERAEAEFQRKREEATRQEVMRQKARQDQMDRQHGRQG